MKKKLSPISIIPVILIMTASAIYFFGFPEKEEIIPPEKEEIIPQKPKGVSGYASSNLSIGASPAPSGKLASDILYNPPFLGEHFRKIGFAHLFFQLDNQLVKDENCEYVEVNACWPSAKARYRDRRPQDLTISVSNIAPVADQNIEYTTLPAILYEVRVKNNGDNDKETLIYHLISLTQVQTDFQYTEIGKIKLFGNSHMGLFSDQMVGGAIYDKISDFERDASGKYILSRTRGGDVVVAQSKVEVPSGKEVKLRIGFVYYDSSGMWDLFVNR